MGQKTTHVVNWCDMKISAVNLTIIYMLIKSVNSTFVLNFKLNRPTRHCVAHSPHDFSKSCELPVHARVLMLKQVVLDYSRFRSLGAHSSAPSGSFVRIHARFARTRSFLHNLHYYKNNLAMLKSMVSYVTASQQVTSVPTNQRNEMFTFVALCSFVSSK